MRLNLVVSHPQQMLQVEVEDRSQQIPIFQVELTIRNVHILLDRLSQHEEFQVGFKFLHFPKIFVWTRLRTHLASNDGSGRAKFSVKSGKRCRFACSFKEQTDQLQHGQLLVIVTNGSGVEVPFEETKPLGCGRLDLNIVAKKFRHGSLEFETSGILDLFDPNCTSIGNVEINFKLTKTNAKLSHTHVVSTGQRDKHPLVTPTAETAVQTYSELDEPLNAPLAPTTSNRIPNSSDLVLSNDDRMKTVVKSMMNDFHTGYAEELPTTTYKGQLKDLRTEGQSQPENRKISVAQRHAECFQRCRKVYESQLSFNIYSQIYRSKAYGYAYNKAYLQRVAWRYLQSEEVQKKPIVKPPRSVEQKRRGRDAWTHDDLTTKPFSNTSTQTGEQMFKVAEVQTDLFHKPVPPRTTPIANPPQKLLEITPTLEPPNSHPIGLEMRKHSDLSNSRLHSIPGWIRRLESEEPEILNTSVYLPVDRLRTPQTIVEAPTIPSSSIDESRSSETFTSESAKKTAEPEEVDSSSSSESSTVSVVEEQIEQTSSEAHSVESTTDSQEEKASEVAKTSELIRSGRRKSIGARPRLSLTESRRSSGAVSPVSRYLQKLQIQQANIASQPTTSENPKIIRRFSSVHTESVSSYEPSDLSDISESQG